MLPRIQTIATGEEFDELLRADAEMAYFSSVAEEEAYATRDEFLIHLMHERIAQQFGENLDSTPHQNEDWWPNHTRCLDMTPAQCTRSFLQSMHELLTDAFANYRIQICVYADVMAGETYVGSMVIYADRVVIEQKLAEHLNFG